MRCPAFIAGAVLTAALAGCPQPPEPAFTEDFRTKYQKVVTCQQSADHALMNVVIWADEKAAPAYDGGTLPVPEGGTVVKEEFSDTSCAELTGYAVMKKDATLPNEAGWYYQVVDAQRTVTAEGAPPQCASCHKSCGAQTDRLCAVTH